MTIEPLHDRVLVRRLDADTISAGGIHIPEAAKEKSARGKVVAVGPGARDSHGVVHPLAVTAGDVVLFGKYAGTEIKVSGEDCLLLREEDVLGIVRE